MALSAHAAARQARAVENYAAELERPTDELVTVNAPWRKPSPSAAVRRWRRCDRPGRGYRNCRPNSTRWVRRPRCWPRPTPTLAEALGGFSAAYADLAADLAASRPGFDDDFLAEAGHAGEALRRAVQAAAVGRGATVYPPLWRWWPGCDPAPDVE